ncbi:hypothetical protein PN462_06905 [Spirulina sp. CS-785/01]|uniref:hypothetical protein n=1 Tax=Spirulina sp. CS-785/01 TaxID=3021716 RepID=UPI00232CF6D4|nr:hypothetical protein [Spirulina sp. CS-785/01]MDB9312825.1 hypothetical protein [Spirulina sp. CS-785/01]
MRNTTVDRLGYEAIAQYLGETVESSETRLASLETQMATLQKTLSQLNLTVASLQKQLITPTPPQPSPQGKPQPDAELLEDEPDEILYDFLPPEER